MDHRTLESLVASSSLRRTCGVLLFAAAITTGNSLAVCQSPAASLEQATEVAETANNQAETRLQDMLTGSVWRGKFSIDGADGKLKAESYEIIEAEKVASTAGAEPNTWLLKARIKYGKRDVTVPLPIQIEWAGSTPVITVDQLTIPGMGTFDARVLIRKGKYAGTWTHDDVGGHLFGSISKKEVEPATDE